MVWFAALTKERVLQTYLPDPFAALSGLKLYTRTLVPMDHMCSI